MAIKGQEEPERSDIFWNKLVFSTVSLYRVFQLTLTDFEDLGGQLKTTYRL